MQPCDLLAVLDEVDEDVGAAVDCGEEVGDLGHLGASSETGAITLFLLHYQQTFYRRFE